MSPKRTSRVVVNSPTAVAAGKALSLSPEVQSMISSRHEAHRRGLFEVAGSISFLETGHGALRFPMHENRPSGLSIGYMLVPRAGGLEVDDQQLVALTEWNGAPNIHEKIPNTQCEACLRNCDVCNHTGIKNCEGLGCGGAGVRPGPLTDCDQPGCMVETKKPLAGCPRCKGFGQWAKPVTCEMCAGSGKIKCAKCKGSGRYSTGIKNGGTDFMVGRCERCKGEQCEVKVIRQPMEPHINALLPDPQLGPWVAIGPILTLAIDLTMEKFSQTGTPVRMFDVLPDAANDHLYLLLDSSSNPRWPYFVGGMLRERNNAGAIMALRGFRQSGE